MTYKGIVSVILCIASIVLIRHGQLLFVETWLRVNGHGISTGESLHLRQIAHAMGSLFVWLGVLGIWLATPSKKIFGDMSPKS